MNSFFKNSIFIQEIEKKKVMTDLELFFAQIKTLFIEHQIPANLYVTGSLARREPSICFPVEGEAELFSDLDFVVATTEEYLQHLFLVHFEATLKKQFPMFNSSAFVLDIKSLQRVRSGVGRDLALSIGDPIFSGLPMPQYPAHQLEEHERFELIIHQLAGYYLHPSALQGEETGIYFRSELTYHYLKLVLEALRSQFDTSAGVVTYRDLFNMRSDARLSHILSPELVESFLRARELFGRYEIPQISMNTFIRQSLGSFFGLEARTVSFEEFLQALEHKAMQEPTQIILFSCALIAFILATVEEGEQRGAAIQVLIRIIKQVVSADMDLDVQAMLAELVQQEEALLEHGITQQATRTMARFRGEYIKCIYERNFGKPMVTA